MWAIVRDISDRKQAETALRQSEQRFKELFDRAPVGYLEYDLEGRITNVNRTDLEMLGYTTEEMIGQPVWSFNTEEVARERIMAKLNGTIPPDRNLERTYRKKDGTTIVVLCQDRLILDGQGKIQGIRGTIQDITERKRMADELRKNREFLNSILDNAPMLIYVNSTDNRFLLVNKAWEKLIGKRPRGGHRPFY